MAIRILTWAFPWLMAILEFLLRSSLHATDATTFIGPTVGGAVLGMMLPRTRARELPSITTKRTTISFDRNDDRWAQLTNLALWIGLIAWAVSLHLSLTEDSELFIHLDHGRTSILIGAILWVTVVVFDILRGDKR
ncbi:hypothetical protein GTP91_22735 [Rugamonas sp. FT82W]|uniref:Uncharacterized protein n=2 Tax=Duganella vulcania TaxID=2692166 RepID=A0A845G6Q2_9BURK|nr:hypothetical protein [Duganella vulcania]